MIGGRIAWLAGSRWALAAVKWGAVGLTVLLFLLSVWRAGERAGQMAQRLHTMDKAKGVQRRVLEAAARRPRSHDELARRLRNGWF